MFDNVTILVLGQRDSELSKIEELARGLSFNVRSTDGVHDALVLTEQTDVLIAVESVPSGPTTPVIRQFLRDCDGPLCIIVDNHIDDDKAYEWFAAGALNIWRRPIKPEAIQATLYRYGRAVINERERKALKLEVTRLKRWLAGIIIGVSALEVLNPIVGGNIVNFIMSLL